MRIFVSVCKHACTSEAYAYPHLKTSVVTNNWCVCVFLKRVEPASYCAECRWVWPGAHFVQIITSTCT